MKTAPVVEESKKLSSKEIMSRLDSILFATRIANLQLNPAPICFYKPKQDGTGVAMKLDLRLKPTFGDGEFVSEVDGGLFLELVAQSGKDDRNNPTFGWKDNDKRITAKLGLPDISGMLYAIRTTRVLGKKLPPTKNDDSGALLVMFHKYEEESTIIKMKFEAKGTVIEISKSKENRRSIMLSLSEEIELQSYLQHSLGAFHLVGKR